MSADFYLKVIPDSEEMRQGFLRLERVSFLCSKFDPMKQIMDSNQTLWYKDNPDFGEGMLMADWAGLVYEVFAGDVQWIGQVSWSKASDADDSEWIPPSVKNINALFEKIGPFVTITPKVITQIMVAMNDKSTSRFEKRTRAVKYVNGEMVAVRNRNGYQPVGNNIYSRQRGVASRRDVKRWLVKHMGQTIVVTSD